MEYDIFCDESRHLENDRFRYMILGAIWCERPARKEIIKKIKELKLKFNFAGEIKWNKVTPKKITFFEKLLQLFFSDSRLNFRCLVVDKSELKHELYNPEGGHEEFYYKVFYRLLIKKIKPPNSYRIFLDSKCKDDSEKIRKLQDILGHTFYDFSDSIITLTQTVHSKQYSLVQLTDLLIGAVGYEWNELKTNPSKLRICELIRFLSNKDTLRISTPYNEEKFEIFKINLR